MCDKTFAQIYMIDGLDRAFAQKKGVKATEKIIVEIKKKKYIY